MKRCLPHSDTTLEAGQRGRIFLPRHLNLGTISFCPERQGMTFSHRGRLSPGAECHRAGPAAGPWEDTSVCSPAVSRRVSPPPRAADLHPPFPGHVLSQEATAQLREAIPTPGPAGTSSGCFSDENGTSRVLKSGTRGHEADTHSKGRPLLSASSHGVSERARYNKTPGGV